MKRRLSLISFLLMFGFLLLGCGSNPRGNSADADMADRSNAAAKPPGAGEGDDQSSLPTSPVGKNNQAMVNLDNTGVEDNYLTLRSAPDTETGKLIAKLQPGTVVTLTKCQNDEVKTGGRSGRWCEVNSGDQTGWVFDAFLVRFNKLNFLITADAAGDIRLGMTIADARKAVKSLKFERTSDAEGVPLVGVLMGRVALMSLYAGEQDNEAPIDNNAKIESIEIWNQEFKTAKGVHAQMKISEAEKKYGKVKEIMLSEIESREFAEFVNHPKGLGFRVRGGVYRDGENTTTKYESNTRILAVLVEGL